MPAVRVAVVPEPGYVQFVGESPSFVSSIVVLLKDHLSRVCPGFAAS